MKKSTFVSIMIIEIIYAIYYFLFVYNDIKLLDRYGEPIPKIKIVKEKRLKKIFSFETTINASVFRTNDELFFRIKQEPLRRHINKISDISINGKRKEMLTVYSNNNYSLYCVDISEFNTTEKINFIIYNDGLYYKNNI